MDDLMDLDWSGAKTSAPPKSSSLAAPARPQLGRQQSNTSSSYNFDALTRAMPASTPSPQPPYQARAAVPQAARSAAPAASGSTSSAGDAFSSLLDLGPTPAAQQRMTLAERQRANNAPASGKAAVSTVNDTWGAGDDWDSLGSSQPAKASSAVSAPAPPSPSDPFDMSVFSAPVQPARPPPTSARPAPARQTAPPVRPSQPAPQAQRKPAKEPELPPRKPAAMDMFDFSEFEDGASAQSSALGAFDDDSQVRAPPSRRPESRVSPKPSVSRGFSDDGLDAFLSGRPSEAAVPPRTAARSSPAPRAQSTSGSRAASPPPHIVGQIVEMGFSPAQARKALAATATGLDVNAALEALLGSQPGSTDEPASREDADRKLAERLQREERRNGVRDDGEWDGEANRAAAQRRRWGDDGVERRGTGTSSPRRRAGDEGQQDGDWAKQADVLYAQASELGAGLFKSANAFWSTAKATAQKALEERQAAGAGSGGEGSGRNSPAGANERAWNRRWGVKKDAPNLDGRPRWMVEAEAAEAAHKARDAAPSTNGAGPREPADSGAAFKDSDDEEQVPESAERRAPAPRAVPAAPAPVVREAAGNLWDDAQPAAAQPKPVSAAARSSAAQPAPKQPYVSPARRGGGRANGAPSPAPAAASQPRKKTRAVEPDAASAVSSAAADKAAGNECFRRGAYSDAETAYSRALQSLATGSLRRIPLLNNRASARLKNGDAPAAIADADAVLVLILPDGDGNGAARGLYKPSLEGELPAELGAEVNLRDAYAKALLRRAQAGEMLEKWKAANADWDGLARYEREEGSGKAGAQNVRAASEGKARCQKMLSSDGGAAPAPRAAPPRPSAAVSAAARRAQAASAAAVQKAEDAARQRVRAEHAAAEAEDAAKHSLKDSVDARILAWRGGKETNLRALLASVENVAWEGMAWKKIGMHELVTDAQVKKAYTRAIGRFHPDKLARASIEEKMTAASVFSALNEAWVAQKK